jgi:hypothetical protein
MPGVSRKPNGLIFKGRNAQGELGITDLKFEPVVCIANSGTNSQKNGDFMSLLAKFPRNLLPSSSVLKSPEIWMHYVSSSRTF